MTLVYETVPVSVLISLSLSVDLVGWCLHCLFALLGGVFGCHSLARSRRFRNPRSLLRPHQGAVPAKIEEHLNACLARTCGTTRRPAHYSTREHPKNSVRVDGSGSRILLYFDLSNKRTKGRRLHRLEHVNYGTLPQLSMSDRCQLLTILCWLVVLSLFCLLL
jgi:hypothetical protein